MEPSPLIFATNASCGKSWGPPALGCKGCAVRKSLENVPPAMNALWSGATAIALALSMLVPPR